MEDFLLKLLEPTYGFTLLALLLAYTFRDAITELVKAIASRDARDKRERDRFREICEEFIWVDTQVAIPDKVAARYKSVLVRQALGSVEPDKAGAGKDGDEPQQPKHKIGHAMLRIWKSTGPVQWVILIGALILTLLGGVATLFFEDKDSTAVILAVVVALLGSSASLQAFSNIRRAVVDILYEMAEDKLRAVVPSLFNRHPPRGGTDN